MNRLIMMYLYERFHITVVRSIVYVTCAQNSHVVQYFFHYLNPFLSLHSSCDTPIIVNKESLESSVLYSLEKLHSC